MLKKTMALALALCVLAATLTVFPALASDYYSARTPLAGSSRAKLNNVNLAVEAINETYIPYGGHFSFNETVGPRVSNRGYKTAPNGRGVKVTGGGVAQVASTLYLALLQVRGDIEIDPVRTYGSRFVDNYVDDPDQAVITDYDADIDLGFTSYEDSLTIDMWANDNYVYCSITVGDDSDTIFDSAGSGEVYDWADSGDTVQDYASSDGWFFGDSPSAKPAKPARRLIASASVYCGDEDEAMHNAELAADSINDTTLNRRDIFSFNDVVGPREKKYGYRRATNGRGARVTGGGVARVASVIWLAIKDLDDFSIIEKSTYGIKYNQDYVDSSSDAILTDYNSGRDFSFRYTGYGSVTLYTYVSDDWLYCDIYRN